MLSTELAVETLLQEVVRHPVVSEFGATISRLLALAADLCLCAVVAEEITQPAVGIGVWCLLTAARCRRHCISVEQTSSTATAQL